MQKKVENYDNLFSVSGEFIDFYVTNIRFSEIINLTITREPHIIFWIFMLLVHAALVFSVVVYGLGFADIPDILYEFMEKFGEFFMLPFAFIIWMIYKLGDFLKIPYCLTVSTTAENIQILKTPDIVLVNAVQMALEQALVQARANADASE